MLLATLRRPLTYLLWIAFWQIILSGSAFGQSFKLKGIVFDSTRLFPLESVTVLSSSGRGAVTNAQGRYEILVNENDSVWFSYLGKPTQKYAVAGIQNETQFDISLQITIPVLKEIRLKPRNYKMDSIQNRLDYAKIFEYEKGKIRPSVTSSGVGFDLTEIIRMFQFRKNKSMLATQRRLLADERDAFIASRFNKGLIVRLTGLKGGELDTFMRLYKPDYDFALVTPEYDFQVYIKKAHEDYLRRKNAGEFRLEEERSF